MCNRETDIESNAGRVGHSAISRPLSSLREAGPALRRLFSLWPLILLGVINIAIVLSSNVPSMYAVAVAVGTLGVAIGVRISANASHSGPLSGIAAKVRDPKIFLPVLGAVLHLFLLVRVLSGPTSGYDVVLWISGIVAFGASFVDLRTLRNIRFSAPPVDTAIVGALMLACLVLHSHDLRDWYYSAIGDEIGFFLRVRQILEEGIQRPFALQGVYHNSPMLNSIYQAYVSWVFGGGAWGWKFSSVLSVALTVPGIYILGYIFAGRVAGIVSAVIILGSHYVMAFTHTGYTHLDALPVTVWAVTAFIVGGRRKSAPILFAAGLLAGLALYTALPARVVFPLFLAWILFSRVSLRQLNTFLPTALGFAVCALPFLLANGLDSVLVMGLDTISPNSIFASEIGDPSSRIADNLSGNLLVWWWNDHMSHYTSGSLLDQVSGILAIVGIGVAVGKWRPSDKLLIVWLILTLVATAVVSPYSAAPLTRMHSNLLPLALLSGVGLSVCLDWIEGYRTHKYVAVGAIMVAIVALNVWRFQVTTPNTLPHYMQESLAIKAWQSDECGRDNATLFVGRDGHFMDLVLLTYIPEGERPEVISYADPLVLPPWPACKIFFRPDDTEAKQRLQILTDTLSKQSTVISNPSGHSYVEIIK
ncbi:MAG: hypothetical protein OXC95_09950 [Dehalococcoidia bacterium]|nr:hypothetical protein [Dehalococcoidia bacterium]